MSSLITRLSTIFQSKPTVQRKKNAGPGTLLDLEPEAVKVKRRSFVLRQLRKAQEKRARKLPFTDITKRRKSIRKRNKGAPILKGVSSKDFTHLTHSRISQLQDQNDADLIDLLYDPLPRKTKRRYPKHYRLNE